MATTAAELPEVDWRISTRSANGGGNCVETGPVLDGKRDALVEALKAEARTAKRDHPAPQDTTDTITDLERHR